MPTVPTLQSRGLRCLLGWPTLLGPGGGGGVRGVLGRHPQSALRLRPQSALRLRSPSAPAVSVRLLSPSAFCLRPPSPSARCLPSISPPAVSATESAQNLTPEDFPVTHPLGERARSCLTSSFECDCYCSAPLTPLTTGLSICWQMRARRESNMEGTQHSPYFLIRSCVPCKPNVT